VNTKINLSQFESRRGDKHLEIVTLDTGSPRRKCKAFKALWVKLPAYWIERLEQSSRSDTFKLAHRILMEAHKRKHVGGEIILSFEVTRISNRTVRARAIKTLVDLELIEIEQQGNRAVRVLRLLHI
jgi:hypothetical protein